MGRRPNPTRSNAVLIGVGSYTHPDLPDIPAVQANLDDLHTLLVGPASGGFTADRCVRVAGPRHAFDIGAVVRNTAQAATDVLLVYYTGHGLLDRRGRLHLALADSDPDHVGWTTLPFETLREELLDSRALVRILILDCCFSGRAFEAMGGQTMIVAGQVEVAGTYTITSSAANQPSFAPAGQRNTAFTAALLSTVETAPEHSLDTLFLGIDDHLRQHGHPRPQRRNINIAGDLILFDNPEKWWRTAAAEGDLDAMVELADSYDRRGEHTEAEPWWRRAAADGHKRGMTGLGWSLWNRGEHSAAEIWWRKAAETGHPAAMNGLGTAAVERGEHGEAETWYRKAADAGYPAAMNNLGTAAVERGEHGEAETWYRKAADAGDRDAMNNLGDMLRDRGESQEAETWYRKAADAGHSDAMNNLGWSLEKRGESADAETWYRKAADAGHSDAMDSSWLNLVERWFAELTTKKLRRSAHTSVRQLNADIRAWINTWNEDPRPDTSVSRPKSGQ